MMRSKVRLVVTAGIVLVILLAAAFYRFVLPGLSSARPEPPKVEIAVATWLLRHSVPEASRKQPNPLGADAADVVVGRDLFREKCEICHGYDGSGRTQIGAGEYPRPPALRTLIASMTDGEIFYHIRNGIRNTGMPAWSMPERQIWQLVLYCPGGAGCACAGCASENATWMATPLADACRDIGTVIGRLRIS